MNESKRQALEYLDHLTKIGGGKPESQTAINCRKYGLSTDKLQAIFKKQDRRCAICGVKQQLVLDHDHATKKARGYLCRRCNILLAGFDNPKLAERIRDYLDNPPATEFYE